MEIISSNRRRAALPARLEEDAAALAVKSDEQSVALREAYGDATAMLHSFAPVHAVAMYRNLDKAVEMRMPSLVDLECAYGPGVVVGLVGAHLAHAIACRGEETAMDATNIRSVAESICLKPSARLLTFASIASFFVELRLGSFQIYGAPTGRKIMEAFDKYARAQNERELAVLRAAEHRAREQEAALHSAEAVSWEEFAAANGIDAPDLASWVMAGCPGAPDVPDDGGVSHE